MKITKTLGLPLLMAFTLTAGAASAGAASAEDQETPAPGGTHGYLPVDEEFYAPYDIEACGTTVTLAGGDVRGVESKEKVKKDGSVVVRYRGDSPVDITRGSPGDADYAFIDELDVSGSSTQRTSADGRHVEFTFRGPGVLTPTDPTSAAGFAEAGLPYAFYFEHGTVRAEAELEPGVAEPLSVEVVHTPRQVVDLCDLLDTAAGT